MSTQPDPQAREEHQAQWDDRLQDWLDGDLDTVAAAEIERHAGSCEICSERLAELHSLDAALRSAVQPLMLGPAFDRRILAQIEGLDEERRAAARQRAREEFTNGLHALSRNWRRALAFALSGAVAGMAIAFAVISQLETALLTQTLAADQPSGLARNLYEVAATMLIGAGIGATVARWLASTTE